MTRGWFSETGLARLHDVMAGHVERGDMPGSIALVARHGRAHVDVIGTRTFGDAEPLRRDDVFRITSMTKPITAAAVMTLVDDGTLHLDAPVDDLLPELANRRVLRSIDARPRRHRAGQTPHHARGPAHLPPRSGHGVRADAVPHRGG